MSREYEQHHFSGELVNLYGVTIRVLGKPTDPTLQKRTLVGQILGGEDDGTRGQVLVDTGWVARRVREREMAEEEERKE
jgi:hypothetical protein